jgi:protein-tyrosine phosphatase
MPSILFVCTANQFRSPLAAASLINYLAQKKSLADWIVESAGTWALENRPVLDITRLNAERLGLGNLADHRSRQVNAELLSQFDLILVMEIGQKEALNTEFRSGRSRTFMLSEVLEGIQVDIPDPIVLGTSADAVANELYRMIQDGADQILDLARKLEANVA